MTDVTTIALDDPAALPPAARRAPTALVWLLDPGAAPQAGALEALLEHADRPAASLPVGADGAPLEALLGRFVTADVADVVEAALRRRAPLRHTHLISLLARAELVAELAPPDVARLGPWAGTEWTARLFAREPGVLVPASRVVAAPPPPGSPVQLARMIRAGVWRRGETLRELQRATTGRWSR